MPNESRELGCVCSSEMDLKWNFEKEEGGLTGPQLLEGVTGKEGSAFFQGGCTFHIKNKLKSEIFYDQKSHN